MVNNSITAYMHTETLVEKMVRIMTNPTSTKEDYLNLGIEIGQEKNKPTLTTTVYPTYPPNTVYCGVPN